MCREDIRKMSRALNLLEDLAKDGQFTVRSRWDIIEDAKEVVDRMAKEEETPQAV